MKRLLSALLVLAMICTFCVPVFAADAVFTLKTPGVLPAVGTAFDVTVSLAENPGINSVQLTLRYDRSVLRCDSATVGSLLQGAMATTNPNSERGVIITAATLNTITADGLIGTVSFTVLKQGQPDFDLDVVSFADYDGRRRPYRVVYEVGGTPVQPADPAEPDDPTDPSGSDNPAPIQPPITFSDISGHWGEKWILSAARQGLFGGYSDGRFGPNDPVTRAQFVAVLYRMAGRPQVAQQAPFTDISNQPAEFQNAISWAYEKGYVNGRENNRFDPGGQLTRQEAMKILFGVSGGRSGPELMMAGAYDAAYTDSGLIASWARRPMYWAVYNGLISGTGLAQLSPRGITTRAQIAKILVDYVDRFGA